ncbi:hypothetical protein D3C80_1656490 [compost metagenome]
MPKPMPLSGAARNCSLMALMVCPRSCAGVSSTGYLLVNQPTVRLRSISSNNASRPWPSNCTNTERSPLQRVITRAKALSSRSLTWVR